MIEKCAGMQVLTFQSVESMTMLLHVVKTTSLWWQDINGQHSCFNVTGFVQLVGKQDSYFEVRMRAMQRNEDNTGTAGQRCMTLSSQLGQKGCTFSREANNVREHAEEAKHDSCQTWV